MNEDIAAVRMSERTEPAPIVVTIADDLAIDTPWGFLDRMRGGPRGFWAWDDGWIAHGGLLKSIELAPGTGPLDVRRFRRVQAAAVADDSEPSESQRWYGGFAFGEDHAAADAWASFPAALFHRPSHELRYSGTSVRLTVRGFAEPGESRDDAYRRLRRDAEALADSARERDDVAAGSGTWAEEPRPDDEPGWREMVTRALRLLGASDLEKVVLARCVDVTTPDPPDPADVVRRLRDQNPRARVFLFEPRAGSALMGASPETVARLVRGSLGATAVAGSAARGETEAADARIAARLMASHKDRYEHQLVVDDMVERLRAWGGMVEVASEPEVLSLARIQHLETRIRTRLPSRIGILDVLADLHPTPAVCGRPRDAAFRFLASEEDFDRGWYGAPVGWFDTAGNGVFVPALRCALANGGTWRLFAGAGIVPESDPSAEWEETALKLETARGALTGDGA